MNKNNHNNFEIVHNELIEFCEECTLRKKAHCSRCDEKCREFSNKFDELYYATLYPFHPCKKCQLVVGCGSIKPCACEAYWHFCRMRLVAECEIKNDVVYFSDEKRPVIFGSSDLISEEYLRSEDYYRNAIDFQITADYITEIKSDPIFSELLSTVTQYLEYCSNHESDNGKTEFREKFYMI